MPFAAAMESAMNPQRRIGYHASHEQFSPSDLLGWVCRAEDAGFGAAMSSDHFHPWTPAQGHSGHAWCWLGAAMARCRLPFGLVTAPVGRQHPAVVAQALATLVQMHGPRLWVAAGSGEALNECITGVPWPGKQVRNERLYAAVEIMRALWRGEQVSREQPVAVREARLYDLPERLPSVYAPALSEQTARWAGGWADGLITVSMPLDRLRAIIDAFRDGGGAGKPLLLQAKLSYAGDENAAFNGAHEQWRSNIFDGAVSEDLRTPQQFEAIGRHVRPTDVAAAVHVSADAARHAAWLSELFELGFEEIQLHNVHREQERFIDVFGRDVLPQLGLAAADAADTADEPDAAEN
jgi:coenzyme F420-dependent glucose-6-phosphate dehydrogenase